MNSSAITVEQLSKKFVISHESRESYNSLRDEIVKRTKKIFSFNNSKGKISTVKEDFWALKNVSFDIKQGERIGIIGRNGAGKSTLLKLLSRITDPTEGQIKISGRIASLLEVGTGFHPELTGRENIFLNGAILGMARAEVRRKFDEIVAFAEVEKFLDTPVKRYSSGMYVRLAFAVAAYLEPEILIVDEVLAVGDAEFQKKCFGKMKDVSANDGRTVVFVSHQMDAISRLCEKVIYLKNGTLSAMGETQHVINKYLNGEQEAAWTMSWDESNSPGSNEIKLLEVKVINESGESKQSFDIRDSIGVQMHYRILQDNVKFTHGFNLYGEDGTHILSSHDTEFAKGNVLLKKGIYSATVWIPKNFLSESSYKVGVAIMSYSPFSIHFNETEVVSFTVFDTTEGDGARGTYGGKFPGLIRPWLAWTSQNAHA